MVLKKVLVAMLKHETNNFLPFRTCSKDYTVLRGNEIYDEKFTRFSGPRGIIHELSIEDEIKAIPSVFCNAIPGGTVEESFYENIKSEILESICNCESLDGIVLDLHGSMITENHLDTEGDLIEEIRKTVGNIPITASLDMHATITEKMLINLNAVAGYHTAPHVDIFETGRRAANIIKRIFRGENVFMTSTRIPVIVAGEKSETDSEPMKSIIKMLKESMIKNKIIDGSIFLGFPWADNFENNANLVIISDDKEYSKEISAEYAGVFWDRRGEFVFSSDAFDVTTAVRKAFESDKNPVFISDSCDNPTAASAGDNTNLLKEIIVYKNNHPQENRKEAAFSAIVDEESVRRCTETGQGKTVTLSLGGKIDSVFSKPVEISGVVKKIYMNYDGSTDIVLFKSNGINIFIASKRFAVAGEWELFEKFGIDVNSQKVVAIKCGYLSDEFKSMASESYFALTNGFTNQNLEQINYTRLTRPIYPLDDITSFIPEPRIIKKP